MLSSVHETGLGYAPRSALPPASTLRRLDSGNVALLLPGRYPGADCPQPATSSKVQPNALIDLDGDRIGDSAAIADPHAAVYLDSDHPDLDLYAIHHADLILDLDAAAIPYSNCHGDAAASDLPPASFTHVYRYRHASPAAHRHGYTGAPQPDAGDVSASDAVRRLDH